jgi:hypothetical protein
LYLALGPKFLTVFSLNSVGQYVDVLAWADSRSRWCRPPAEEPAPSRPACARWPWAAPRRRLLAAAVATCYAIAVLRASPCARPGPRPRWGWTIAGSIVGALPVSSGTFATVGDAAR